MATPASGPVPESNPLIDTFFSPAAAMDALARRPRFVLPLLIVTVIGVATMTVAFQRGVVERGIRQKMESNPRFEQVPADRREAIIEQSARIGSYTAVGGAVVGPLIGLLLTSGVLLLVITVTGGGAKVKFGQMMAVVSHSWLPLSLASLIGIPILLAKDPEAVDFQNILPMANLSFLFSSTEQHKLYMAATSFDLFSFWVMGLMAIGIARLTGKGMGAALMVILIQWALYVAIFKVWLG